MLEGFYWYECKSASDVQIVCEFLRSEGFENVKIGKIGHHNKPFIIKMEQKCLAYLEFDLMMNSMEREMSCEEVRKTYPYIDLMSVIRYHRFKSNSKDLFSKLKLGDWVILRSGMRVEVNRPSNDSGTDYDFVLENRNFVIALESYDDNYKCAQNDKYDIMSVTRPPYIMDIHPYNSRSKSFVPIIVWKRDDEPEQNTSGDLSNKEMKNMIYGLQTQLDILKRNL